MAIVHLMEQDLITNKPVHHYLNTDLVASYRYLPETQDGPSLVQCLSVTGEEIGLFEGPAADSLRRWLDSNSGNY